MKQLCFQGLTMLKGRTSDIDETAVFSGTVMHTARHLIHLSTVSLTSIHWDNKTCLPPSGAGCTCMELKRVGFL